MTNRQAYEEASAEGLSILLQASFTGFTQNMMQVGLPNWLAKDAEGKPITQVQRSVCMLCCARCAGRAALLCGTRGTAADGAAPGLLAQADFAFTDLVAIAAALAVASTDLAANHQIFTLNNLLGGDA